ncbi:sll0787 family AIR synthase-like protein [Acinetobacter sp.]|uniref:sll0787 family AIR synthase-like protein n=1 Tax=Acinetobacter sp. TaxID=472 RepID=UPI00388CF8B6
MTQLELERLVAHLRQTPAMQSKMNIAQGLKSTLPNIETMTDLYALPGDDTAAIETDHGYMLHACEGMIPSFVEHHPYFAGWSAVMANISDISAMGGRATSVVNSFWHRSTEQAQELIRGMQDACQRYAVPLVGGHTHIDPNFQPALSVAIQGEANRLLSVMHVQPQQKILLALNMKGQFHPDTTYWKCFEGVEGSKLQAELEVLPQLAELGLAYAARDISNAGILGSLLMLLEASGCGADIQLDQVNKPQDVDWQHWLQIFPSYGFLITADEAECEEIIALFEAQNLHCRIIGEVNATAKVQVSSKGVNADFWDFQQQLFTGLCYAEQIQYFQRDQQDYRQAELSVCQA